MKGFGKKISHRIALAFYSLVTLLVFSPGVAEAAGPTDIGGAVTSIEKMAAQIGTYLTGLFTAVFGILLAVRLWGYTHASDDSDLKMARKKITHSVIGAIGFLLATLVLAFIKQYL